MLTLWRQFTLGWMSYSNSLWCWRAIQEINVQETAWPKLTSRVDGQLPNRLMMAQNVKGFTACIYLLLEKDRAYEEKM